MDFNKSAYCIYTEDTELEFSKDCFKIYLPSEKGYVNYNIVHSVNSDITADIWRLGRAFAYNDDLSESYPLTPVRAEWDMAVMIEGRDDFIGGSNHGDEIFTSMRVEIDGAQEDVFSIRELRAFENIKIFVESVGYDPCDHKTKVLLHNKEYSINKEGITLAQSVTWLGDYAVGSSYLAMMPPCKSLTEMYFTDNDKMPKSICHSVTVLGAKSATLYSEKTKTSFTMSIDEYPTLNESGRFLITDNSGNPYNKMYFFACKGDEVKAGDVWRSVTRYKITVG